MSLMKDEYYRKGKAYKIMIQEKPNQTARCVAIIPYDFVNAMAMMKYLAIHCPSRQWFAQVIWE